MAYDLNVGGGRVVKVNEPTRGEFSDNLGGAVEFSFAHLVYKVFEIMGGALGSFGAGVAVKFLEVIEPTMIDYVGPLIDQLVSYPDMPQWLKDYLTDIKSGEHEAAALLLGDVGKAAVGSATGGIIGSLLSPVTYAINHQLHPFRPDPMTLLAYKWRGKLPENTLADYMEDVGYADFMFNEAEEVMRPRLAEGGLAEAYRRGDQTEAQVIAELARRGYPYDDAKLFTGLTDVLLPGSDVIIAMRRKRITRAEAQSKLERLGYSDEDAATILLNTEIIPQVTDLILMAVREAWRDDIAQTWGYDEDFPTEFGEWAAKQGLDPIWATRYWRSHWRLPSVSLGYEMMHRGIISEGELGSLLKISDYPAGWRDKMVEVAYSPLTRVDVRRMYGLGVLTEEDVYQSYRDIGYNDLNATRMTQFTLLYVNKDDTSKVEEARDLTRSVIETAYRKDVISHAEAETRLQGIDYTTEDIDLLLSLVDVQKELAAIPDYLSDYQSDLQKIVIRSYTRRLIGEDIAKQYLMTVGLSEVEIELQLAIADFEYSEAVRDKELDIIGQAYVHRAIDRTRALELLGHLSLPATQQNQILAEWESERQLRSRRLTEAQYRKALSEGLIGIENYAENLRGLGYTETDIVILVGMATYVKEE